MLYEVCSLDVWGNAEEGYDVKDVYKIGVVELDEDMADSEILQACVDQGFLDDCAVELGEVETSDGAFITISVKSDGKPVLNLYLEQ